MSGPIKKAIQDAEVNFYKQADSEIIQEVLKEVTPDMEKYIDKRDKAMIKIQFLANALEKKQQDAKLLQLASQYREAIERNINKPIQFLRSLMSQKVSAAFNNNLEKLSQEEIIELIKDQNLVNLLDQLDQDGSDNKG